MRITICTLDSPSFTGGPNTWIRRFLPALKNLSVDINVLLFSMVEDLGECPCYQQLRTDNIEIEVFSWWETTEKKAEWILKRLNNKQPDVFIPNLIIAGYFVNRWLKQSGIPTIGVLHSDDDFYRGISEHFVFGKLEDRVSAVVPVSQFLEKTFSLNKGSSTLVKRIPYGVPLPNEVSQKPANVLKLVYAGRIEEEQKRIVEVTLALCQVIKEIPGTEAIIYGEGSARNKVEKILDEQAKHLPISFGGLIDSSNVQSMMLNHHVFVLLSDYEGLPIALMEAMSCGLVPVCLNIRSGVPELVEDQVTGIIVQDRDLDFIKAIKKLKHDPDFWQKLSSSARQKIELSYSHDVCTSQWLSLLTEVLEGRKESDKKILVPSTISLPPIYQCFKFCDFRRKSSVSKLIHTVLAVAKAIFRKSNSLFDPLYKFILGI